MVFPVSVSVFSIGRYNIYMRNNNKKDITDKQQSYDDREFGITMQDYYGGSFMLVWDRTPDRCNRFHRHITDSGSISINLKTRAPSQQTVTVVIYATYSKDLIIDNDKVLTDAF